MNLVMLDAMLQRLQVTEPVTLEDLTYVREKLRSAFPDASVEVYRNKPTAPIIVRVGDTTREITPA